MSDPTRYPLEWPAHKPRTPASQRRFGKFRSSRNDNGWRQSVSIATALERVDLELDRLGARWPIISSNVEPRLDGRPRSGQSAPVDPGVCVYFDLRGKPHAMACDTFTDVAQNLAAIAAHLDATRAIERYGVATAAEALQAFAALPPPPNAKPKRPWWEVLGVERQAVDCEDVRAMFKARARKAHPDTGGSSDAMAELNVALEEALRELAA